MEVIPGIYRIRSRTANAYLIAEDKLSLIDSCTRGTKQKIIRYIKDIGRRPEELDLIILTHYHPDHSGAAAGLRKLSGAKIAIHQNDADILAGLESYNPSSRSLLVTKIVSPI